MLKGKKWLFIAAGAVFLLAGIFGVRATRSMVASRNPLPETDSLLYIPTDSLLYIPLERTVLARQDFLRAYRMSDKQHAMALYEKFLPRIGANGLGKEIQTVNPFCHAEAHDLGKLIFSRLQDVGASLESCADACTSGCMHGVLMQFFTASGSTGGSGHQHSQSAQLTASDIAGRVSTFCESAALTRMYRPGDCAHGVGHAAMFLSKYDAATGIALCEGFPSYGLRYYCATGAYMEYWWTRSRPKQPIDAALYPCDKAPYPAACFRYAMTSMVSKNYRSGGTLETLQRQCAGLSAKYRLGCFHGLGFAHLARIAGGRITLAEVCGYGTRADQTVCIEGAMERLGRFSQVLAASRCESLTDWRRGVCQAAAEREMYDTEKSFALYRR
jgi:hypothetical protein